MCQSAGLLFLRSSLVVTGACRSIRGGGGAQGQGRAVGDRAGTAARTPRTAAKGRPRARAGPAWLLPFEGGPPARRQGWGAGRLAPRCLGWPRRPMASRVAVLRRAACQRGRCWHAKKGAPVARAGRAVCGLMPWSSRHHTTCAEANRNWLNDSLMTPSRAVSNALNVAVALGGGQRGGAKGRGARCWAPCSRCAVCGAQILSPSLALRAFAALRPVAPAVPPVPYPPHPWAICTGRVWAPGSVPGPATPQQPAPSKPPSPSPPGGPATCAGRV